MVLGFSTVFVDRETVSDRTRLKKNRKNQKIREGS